MKLTFLGTASGISMPGRGHASVALESSSCLYFFDLGEPVGRTMLELGLPIPKLRAAFVSHMHSDHSGGLPQFIKNLHLYHNHPDYLPQVDRIAIALPAEAVNTVRAFLAACYMFPESMMVGVDFLPILPGPLYADEDISLTAHPTSHFDRYRDFLESRPEYAFLSCQSFAFEILLEGKRLLYSGDVGSVDDIIPLAAGVDLLILEFGHLLPLEENLKRLSDLGIRKIVLTHIFPDFTDKTSELQETADAVLPGVVTVADDGLTVEM